MYDCLTLYSGKWEAPAGHIDLNRAGSAHVLHRFDDLDTSQWGWPGFWPDALSSPVRAIVERLSRAAGLPPIKELPSTSNEVLVYRVMSAVVTATAFDSVPWSARMGFADTSGVFGGLREHLFEPFPHMTERLPQRAADDLFGEPGYRFWFLLRDDEPVVAFERDGTAETIYGEIVDLRSAYQRSDRRIWPVTQRLVGRLLP